MSFLSEISDALTFKNVPNMGMRVPFRFTIENEDIRPIAFLTKEMVEGSICLEKNNEEFNIGLADVGSSKGEDAARQKRIINKYMDIKSFIDMLDPSFIKDFINEYSKESAHFSYCEEDISLGRKLIKYCVLKDEGNTFHLIVCYNMMSREGLLFQFHNPTEAMEFSKKLNIDMVEIIDWEWDLIEEIPIQYL